jgi:3-oxoacyl-[acyl-carrier-protein] synthase-1
MIVRSRRHPPCALSALGMVNALGSSLDEIWPRLVAGDQSRFRLRDDLVPGEAWWFGEVEGELPAIPEALSAYACRANRLGLAAYAGIRDAVETLKESFGAARIGVVVGSSTGGVAEAQAAFVQWSRSGAIPESFQLVQLEFGGVAEFLARIAGAQGPCYTLSTACSASAKALVSARALLELDVCDAVVAGGVDTLCGLTANGFVSLQAVAKGLTNPMSRNRSGITLGEGAALFVVTREPGGVQLLGAGESSDAHHMSAPEPEGKGAEACMRAALVDAGLEPEAIAYLNLHGTGTPQNDATESAAVERVFARPVPCSSTKPLVGHALGASGALEAGFCWMMLRRRDGARIAPPPHRWDGVRDPNLPPLALVPEATWIHALPPSAIMSNSFGFGGSNCSVILAEEPA